MEEKINNENFQYIWSLRQDNTAVNIIRYDEQLRSVELLNSTAHLQK